MNELADLDLSDTLAELRPIERLWAAVAIQALADATTPSCACHSEAATFVNCSAFQGIWEWTGLDSRIATVGEVREKVRYSPSVVRLAIEDFRT